jgi:flagellar basal-body rod protein FlgG
MNPVLDHALGAIQASMSSLDRIALNVANVQTPGFRRTVAAAGFDRTLADARQNVSAPTPLVHLDTRPATLRTTGRDLDVALEGEGWFEVRLPDGPAYTRKGAFRLDGEGRLVTEEGHPVLGMSGEIRLVQSTLRVDTDGKVFDGAPGAAPGSLPPVGQLKVVRFAPGALAERLPDGLLRFRADPLPLEAAPRVRQGSLENANVNQAAEMLQLMQAVRQVETLQKVTVAYDDLVGTALRRLGDPT